MIFESVSNIFVVSGLELIFCRSHVFLQYSDMDVDQEVERAMRDLEVEGREEEPLNQPPPADRRTPAERFLEEILNEAPPNILPALSPPRIVDPNVIVIEDNNNPPPPPPRYHPQSENNFPMRPRRAGREARRRHNRRRNMQMRITRQHYAGIGDAIFQLARAEFLNRRPWRGGRRGN